jgi:hypothetical protein
MDGAGRTINVLYHYYYEPVPKLIDCAFKRTVLDQALAVSQAFSLAKLRILMRLFQNFSFGTASLYKILFHKCFAPY